MAEIKRPKPQPFTAINYQDTKYSSFAGPLVTAFGHIRTAEPFTIFDSKQLADKQPLFWDDQEVSGGSTGSTYNADAALTTLTVGTNAGKRVRQTFQSPNYQPGKGQVVTMTGILGDAESGITSALGLFNDNDGLMFEMRDGVASVNRRSSSSGSVVQDRVIQSAWNVDGMDGKGPSGVTIDFTKTQVFFIDYQWLSVGGARFGFNIDGTLVYCHEFQTANTLSLSYMSTPNLPIRFELENDGTGSASTMVQICAAVYSEGGQEDVGLINYESTTSNRAGTTHHTNANAANVVYALIGIKLKAAYIGATIKIQNISVLAETVDNYEWMLLFNPTVDGTFTFANKTNSALQTAIGEAANPSTNVVSALGTVLDGGYVHSAGGSGRGGDIAKELNNALKLGVAIDGTTIDEIVLAVRPLTADADIHGGITWRELS